jgi:high-affinity iron transporter
MEFMLALVPILLLSTSPWSRFVGLLQYLEGDYPAALSSQDEDELREQVEYAEDAQEMLREFGADGQNLVPELDRLVESVKRRDPGPVVAELSHELIKKAVVVGNVVQAPRQSPDLAQAQSLWKASCAACHGADGRADTPTAQALKPAPANFHDPERMRALTPYKAFNSITFGIKGTSMAPFSSLTDDQRWGLAFYIFTLREKPCDRPPPSSSLEQLATSTDEQLQKAFGADAVSCLRQELPKLDQSHQLDTTRQGIQRAIALHESGHWGEAKAALTDAYLEGLEPIEPILKTRDALKLKALELGFSRARAAIGQRNFNSEAEVLLHLVNEAERAQASEFWSVMLAALLIVLREGFEALVVVGCLLAVLKKMNAKSSARVVHFGWISALFVGAAAFVVGHRAIAGAQREWVETIVGLLAAAMLIYAALWLNARANISRMMGELRHKMVDALGTKSAVGLFTISFTAVARESFETALFIQGLAIDSLSGAVWGALGGLVALGALVMGVSRVGFRLPMKTLFNASTVLLVATAVVMVGKSTHGLQELGVAPAWPIPFVEIATLGVFPDAMSLGAQTTLGLFCWMYLRRKEGPRRAASSSLLGNAAPTPHKLDPQGNSSP